MLFAKALEAARLPARPTVGPPPRPAPPRPGRPQPSREGGRGRRWSPTSPGRRWSTTARGMSGGGQRVRSPSAQVSLGARPEPARGRKGCSGPTGQPRQGCGTGGSGGGRGGRSGAGLGRLLAGLGAGALRRRSSPGPRGRGRALPIPADGVEAPRAEQPGGARDAPGAAAAGRRGLVRTGRWQRPPGPAPRQACTPQARSPDQPARPGRRRGGAGPALLRSARGPRAGGRPRREASRRSVGPERRGPGSRGPHPAAPPAEPARDPPPPLPPSARTIKLQVAAAGGGG